MLRKNFERPRDLRDFERFREISRDCEIFKVFRTSRSNDFARFSEISRDFEEFREIFRDFVLINDAENQGGSRAISKIFDRFPQKFPMIPRETSPEISRYS
eukprot:1046613-Amorphochlora_amoeboformis.AAC.1